MLRLIFSLGLLLLSGNILAEEAKGTQDSLQIIGQMVNWAGVGSSVVLLIGAWLLLKFVDNLVEELCVAFASSRLTIQRLNAFFHFFIYFIAVVGVLLLSFDFNRQLLAVIGGGLAVSIGFASRDLLASIVSGIMIVFDRPFQVGDRVSFGDQYGDVLQIGLRSVKLRTLDDSIVTIPNNLFLNDVSSSANFGVLDMQIETDFYIGVNEDAALARQLVREAAVISLYIYLPKPIIVNVEQVVLDSTVALRVRLKAYVLDTHYEKRFTTDITLRVLDAFKQHHIQIPALRHQSL
ncbi:mechanosensitive ion channel family protein [Oceanicoccus sagamiensis]|uniref:Potassium transporter KefA n=1 Tax=Oceanicoccus sagamiensis TaxID=716816 RepID=A0A1X9NFC9_9GAMM|nr:mechanosensitive ion channel domain-containing protein [Oceanicoccus sagamiensis]ARN75744.1 potassium transporter KefA [Oceanicoccus sagamiensis]